MKTRFNYISADWTRVKNHCRTTVNKDFTDNEPTEEFKRKLLISEHSPIRLLEVDWSWEDIYSWVATHWSRHKFEKFISTQRDDRTEQAFGDFDPVWLDIDGTEHHPYKTRNDKPQGALVRFDGFANAQSLIDAFRKRLCFQASPETRELAEDFKCTLHDYQPEIADVLVPNCIYRCGCPEFAMCKQKYFEYFQTEVVNELVKSPVDSEYKYDFFDISARYENYNKLFYKTHAMY